MDKLQSIAKDPTIVSKLIIQHKAVMLSTIAIIMIIVIIIALFTWFGSLMTRESRICNTMNTLYASPDRVAKGKSLQTNLAIPIENCKRVVRLRDFYIKTAYNCCSAGDFKNSFVSTCALKNCIRQGARCLDFEIYSIDNMPVIATSTLNSCKIKETYNSVPFNDAMTVIESMAFDSSITPYANDPLLLNLRLKNCPENVDLFSNMAATFNSVFTSKRLLEMNVYGQEYRVLTKTNSGEEVYYHYNLGEVPIILLMGKVIIMVDKMPSSVKACDKPLQKGEPNEPPCRFFDFINIAGDDGFLNIKRYSELKSAASVQEIVNECKNKMCICLPDISNYPNNMNFTICKSYGIQMIAMCFQNFDANMESCDLFFNGVSKDASMVGSFILKPENMLAPLIEPIRVAPPNPNHNPAPNIMTSATGQKITF